MALEIKTTLGADGAMATHTPGAAGYGNPYGDLFASLIRQKMANQSAKAAPAMSQAPEVAYRQPERQAPPPPTMGQAPIMAPPPRRAPATRMRRVQIRSPLSLTPMEGKGLTYDEVPETQLEDGSWSLDAVHGTLGGNEAAARQKMEILYRDPGGHGGGDDGRRRTNAPMAPINPRNRNNDARGEGFGMDFGR